MNRAQMLRTDDIRRLLEVKDFNNKTRFSRADSVGSNDSDRSDLSTKSMPQYSSYRALSGGLFGPFEKSSSRPGSRTGFLHLGKRGCKTPEMSHIPAPTSHLKTSLPKPRGAGEGSSRPNSRAESSIDEAAVKPEKFPETSASKLPVFRREASMPQIKRESSIPQIKREKSDIKTKGISASTDVKTKSSSASTNIIPATPKGKTTPIIPPSTPKTVAVKEITERNIPAKGTHSGVSGISENVMIGDRVSIVGTSKKGIVQFVGETKFAKGVWVGVVLDDATGKNDGSVSGVRYFTCPALRGVFVKEDKLEKIADIQDKGFTPHGTAADHKVSTDASKTSLAAGSNSSLNTDLEDDLNIGDYVCITSVAGNREGILRFLGPTEFAKGTWCGVELEEPNGKNDGAVAGTRYFKCEPKHGLFSQVSKVKKIPAPQTKSSVPTFHNDNDEVFSSSRESTYSPSIRSEDVVSPDRMQNTTIDSDTANALLAVDAAFAQEDLKSPSPFRVSPAPPSTITPEIDNQIQLHKQDIELQSLYNEQKQERIRRESTGDKILRELQENALRLQGQVGVLEREKLNLQNELNDAKLKIEDLQFRLEEQLLIRAEENKGPNKEELDKVLGLQNQLEVKEKEIDTLKSKLEKVKDEQEQEIFLLNEKEIQLEGKDKEIEKLQELLKVNENLANNEVSNLKQKIKELRDLQASVSDAELKNDNLRGEFEEKILRSDRKVLDLQDKIKEKDFRILQLDKDLNEHETKITNLQFQLEKTREELNETLEYKGTLNKQVVDLNQELVKKRQEIQQSSQFTETMKYETLELKAKLEASESRNNQLNEDKQKLEEDILKVSKNSGDNAQQLVYLNEQIQSKNKELANVQDQLSTLKADNHKLTQEITNMKERFEKEKTLLEKEKNEENEKLRESINIIEENYKKVKVKNEEIEEISRKEKLELQQSSNEIKKLNELNQSKEVKFSEFESEIKALQEKLNELTKLLNQHQTEHDVTKKELLCKIDECEEYKQDISKLKTNYNVSKEKQDYFTNEIQNLRIERTNLEKRLNCILQEKETYVTEKDGISKIYNEVIVKVEHLTKEKEQLLKSNTSLEKEKENLEKQCNKLTDELKISTSTAQKFEEQVCNFKQQLTDESSNLTTLQANITTLQNELSVIKANLQAREEQNKTLQNENDHLQKQNADLNTQYKLLQDKITKKSLENDEVTMLREQLKESNEREQTLHAQLNTERSELQSKINTSIISMKSLEVEINQLRESVKLLEEKNLKLQNELEAPKTNNGVDSSSECSRLREEMEKIKAVKEEKEQEVNFLNSIIVDLQAKNREQEQKIRTLSFGDNPEDLLPTTSINDTINPVRSDLRPRLFCDICDIFDSHDTEDCPLQSNDGGVGGSKHHGVRGVERPYCTSCETFGHTADQCDDEEMF